MRKRGGKRKEVICMHDKRRKKSSEKFQLFIESIKFLCIYSLDVARAVKSLGSSCENQAFPVFGL